MRSHKKVYIVPIYDNDVIFFHFLDQSKFFLCSHTSVVFLYVSTFPYWEIILCGYRL